MKYLELDRLLKDRGAAGGLVIRPEAVLRHHTVTKGWDLDEKRKGSEQKQIKRHFSGTGCFTASHR